MEIDRFFPSSKTCSLCLYQMFDMPLDVRKWTCLSCGTHDDRDEKMRAEGIRKLLVSGTRTTAQRGEVSPKGGCKSVLTHSPVNSEVLTTAPRESR
jgi:putative transposase